MKRENIQASAKRFNMDNIHTYTFVEFFSRRFPDESDNITSYVDTWASRFTKGNPTNNMDFLSTKVYEKVIAEEFDMAEVLEKFTWNSINKKCLS